MYIFFLHIFDMHYIFASFDSYIYRNDILYNCKSNISFICFIRLYVLYDLSLFFFTYKCKIYLLYFYPDGIIKYDGFSTFQVDGTISKETLFVFTRIQRKDILID
jgi:hypothetical protein